MIENFDIYEMLVLALISYAVYRASKIEDLRYKHVLYVLVIAGLLVLNGAGGSTETMETADNDPVTFALGNFNAYELMIVAAFGYSAWRLYQAGDTYGAAAAAGAALFGIRQGGDQPTTN